MIGLILYVFALLFVQQMALYLQSAPQDETWRLQRHYFCDVVRTGLTLLQSTMGGLDWNDIYVLIEPLGAVYIMAFIFYIAFFHFAVLNILTGIFVENAMKICMP